MSAPGDVSLCPSDATAGPASSSPWPCPQGIAEPGPPAAQCLEPGLPPSCPPPWLGWWDRPWPPGPALTAPMENSCFYRALFPGEPLVHMAPWPTVPTAQSSLHLSQRGKYIPGEGGGKEFCCHC